MDVEQSTAPFVPTPEHIAAETMIIKMGWNAGEERRRRGIHEGDGNYDIPGVDRFPRRPKGKSSDER